MDAHLLQAVATADGEFEIADGKRQDLIETVAVAEILLVLLEVAGSGGVLEKQPSPRMVRKGLEDSAVALLGLRELVAILVQDAEVDQAADARRVALQGLLVAGRCLVVVSEPIVQHSHLKERAGVAGIDGNRPFQGSENVVLRAAGGGENPRPGGIVIS